MGVLDYHTVISVYREAELSRDSAGGCLGHRVTVTSDIVTSGVMVKQPPVTGRDSDAKVFK